MCHELPKLVCKDAFPKFVGSEETPQPSKIADGFPTKECALCLVPCQTKRVDEEEEHSLLAVHCEKKLQCKGLEGKFSSE